MISAFGIEHGSEVSKLFDYGGKKKPSAGRRALASAPYTSTFHPIVAGKKGKKTRATANQWGGGIIGGTAGSAVGGAVGRAVGGPHGMTAGASLGSLAGGVVGTQGGLARNTRKGYLKKES